MLFMGVPFLSKVWTHLWQVTLPDDPQLRAALSSTWAVAAPEKGALLVMAAIGLISKDRFARTVLFASMSLVPPLNIAFPFRQQGFLFGPVAVATVLSTILWGSFFLFGEWAHQAEHKEASSSYRSPPSRWEIFQYAWFAVYSAAVTLMALLFLLWPGTALRLTLPCLAISPSTSDAALSSLIHTNLATGTHLVAVATACWIATVNCLSNPVLRRALTAAGAVHAALFAVFPLSQIALVFGGSCATGSVLIVFVPLFVGWVLYAVLAYGVGPARTVSLLR
jgi:hypothetical protein